VGEVERVGKREKREKEREERERSTTFPAHLPPFVV
jgi:hypothetical protein